MLELKGPFTLVEVLQLLEIKGGSHVVEAAGGVLHVRDGKVVWFSGGGPEECIRFIAHYSGDIKVRAQETVKEGFSTSISEAILKAVFEAPEHPARGAGEVFSNLEGENGA